MCSKDDCRATTLEDPIKGKRFLQDRELMIIWDCVAVLSPFVFFYDVVIFVKGTLNLLLWQAILIFILLNGSLFAFFFIGIRRLKSRTSLHNPGSFRDSLPLLFVLLLTGFLAALQFGFLPKYDGALYYDQILTATSSFNFTIDSLLSSFVLWTHPTFGMMLFIVPAELLMPGSSVGVYGITFVIFLLSVAAFDRILAKLFPDMQSLQRSAITLFYAIHPYVLGLFSHVNPDHYSLYFFILLIWAYAYDREILAAFFCLLLVFTKETGIIFAGPFLLCVTFSSYFHERQHNRKKAILSLLGRFFRYGLSPVLFFLYYRFSGEFSFAVSQTGVSPLRWDNNGLHCFGLSFPYISMRMSQVFFFNFFWIVSVLFVLAVGIYFFRKYIYKHEPSLLLGMDRFDLFVGIFLSFFLYFVVSLLFITLALPRYNVYFVLPAAIVVGFALQILFNKNRIRLIGSFALALIVLVQNYISIDPTLYLVSSKLDLGKTIICSPTRYHDLDIVYEMYTYNRQFAYTDDLVDNIFLQFGLNEHDTVITIDDADYEFLITGEEEFTNNPIYYDPDRHERTYLHTNPNSFVPTIMNLNSSEMETWKDQNLPDHLVVILLWRNNDPFYIECLKQLGYTVDQQLSVENYAGIIYAYRLSRE